MYSKDNFENIYCPAAGSKWGNFIDGILLSIQNRKLDKYPYAKLNSDQSISFFLHKCSEINCEECAQTKKFEERLNASYITEQLNDHREKRGFQLIDQNKKIIEHFDYSESTNIIEYRINMNPRDLDSILKPVHSYSYRGENSLLKLYDTFELKPSSIMLFPVYLINENKYIIRADGCQVTEMAGIQLLHLMPNYQSEEKYFHWLPEQIEKELFLSRADIEEAILDCLNSEQMLIGTEPLGLVNSEGYKVIVRGIEMAIKAVPMDNKSNHFYALYGNTGEDELDNCKSLEINTSTFLQALVRALNKKYNFYEKNEFYLANPAELLEILRSIIQGISLINKMIIKSKEQEMIIIEKQASMAIAFLKEIKRLKEFPSLSKKRNIILEDLYAHDFDALMTPEVFILLQAKLNAFKTVDHAAQQVELLITQHKPKDEILKKLKELLNESYKALDYDFMQDKTIEKHLLSEAKTITQQLKLEHKKERVSFWAEGNPINEEKKEAKKERKNKIN